MLPETDYLRHAHNLPGRYYLGGITWERLPEVDYLGIITWGGYLGEITCE